MRKRIVLFSKMLPMYFLYYYYYFGAFHRLFSFTYLTFKESLFTLSLHMRSTPTHGNVYQITWRCNMCTRFYGTYAGALFLVALCIPFGNIMATTRYHNNCCYFINNLQLIWCQRLSNNTTKEICTKMKVLRLILYFRRSHSDAYVAVNWDDTIM